MKKIFTLLCGMLLSVGAFAEFGYDVTFTQNDFNSSSTVVKKSGTIEWDGGAVRCGGSSTSITGGPAWNWDEKSFDVHLANGVPAKLSFQYKGNAGGSTGVTFKVQESANGSDWTEVWSTTTNTTSYKSISKDLQLSTRYLRFSFAGNFAGLFKDIKVTEKILMGTPNPTSLDFGTVKVDDEASKSFTLGWTNLTATVTGSTEQFSVTPESFGQIGAYTQTATISVALNTSSAGEYSTTVHVEGRGKSADVPVTAKVEKYDQTINWEPAETYNYGEAIPVATATSGLEVSYEISDESVLKFENGAFVTLYAGEVTITAKQGGNYKYNAAEDVVRTITIVSPTTYDDFEKTTCDEEVEFFGQMYNASYAGDVNVGKNYMGGDSIVHVNIIINHATVGEDSKTIVYGDEVEWNGIALKDSTVGEHTVVYVTTNAAGCDSTVTLTLTVKKQEIMEVPVALSFCAGDSAEYRGKWYFEAVEDSIPAIGDTRDTLYIVTATVLQPTFGAEEKTITFGDEVEWNGIALKDSTVGEHTVVYVTTNAAGCDSTVTLTLTVKKQEIMEVPVALSFCAGDSAEYRGKWYFEAVEDSIPAIGDTRDTLYIVTATVLQPTFATEEKTITFGDEVEWNGIALKDSTVGEHTVVYVTTNVAGCDSTVTLTLTVNKLDTLKVPVELTFCAGGSEWYRGVEYTEAGTFNVPAEGTTQDTLYVVNVTVLQPSFDTDELTMYVGEELEWNGIALKDSTVGTHAVVYVTTNVAGCDSTVTLTLTVNERPTTYGEYEAKFCEGDSVEFAGKWYFEATQENVTLEEKNIFGGDSIVALTVTMLPVYALEERDTVALDSVYEWKGEIRPTAEIGTFEYTKEYTTVDGCDSTVTLYLTVVEPEIIDPETPTALDNVGVAQKAVKEFRNGVLYIRRGDKEFTLDGRLVK